MKKILKLMMVACLFLSLFTNCSEKDDEDPIIITSLTVDKTSFSAEATASNEQIAILSNKDWTAKTNATWLSISPSSGKADSKLSVDISVSANPATEARSATITITAADKSAEVKVEQKGKVIIPGLDIADAKFKQYLVEAFDTDKDEDISTGEAEAVTAMNPSGKGIESLSGIEFFVNLESLNCNNNSLTTLDISKNTKLTTLSCDSNKIDSLGLASNTLLKVLSCSSNGMTKLDISNNKELADLNCSLNKMTKLDVSKNIALTDLNCSSNELTGLDVRSNPSIKPDSEVPETITTRLDISNNTLLKTLDCSKNKLTVLDISKNSELTKLICSYNNLTVLDVSNNSKLKNLDCRNNESLKKILLAKDQVITDLQRDDSTTEEYPAAEKKLVNIPDAKFKAYLVGLFDTDKDGEISEEEALVVKEIKCFNKEISSLTGISAFVNLEILDCSRNNIAAIDISKNLKLKEFDCSTNPLITIDISKNTALTKLYCYSCKLTSLNVESNINLIELNCSGNKTISSINLTNNTALQRLYCQGNALITLDLRKNLQLKILNCRNNTGLTTLYLEEKFVIETLFIDTPPTNIVYPNYITFKNEIFYKYLIDNFDADKDGKLSTKEVNDIKEIDCSNLGITSLDDIYLIKNLTSLICSGNKLTSINISSHTALLTFRCDSNLLSSIDVSKNVLLETLSCSKNTISSIDVTSNVNLKHLICNGNYLGSVNVNTNKKLETLLCHDNMMTLILYLNNNLSLKTVNCTNNKRLRIVFLKTGQVIETLLYDDETTEINYTDDSGDNGSGDNTVTSINIPDPKFKAYLLELCDTNKDGLISEEEAKKVTVISCALQGITSLSGIEYFTNLVNLNCNSNSLTSLSLSSNTKLTDVNCYSNNISSLDVTGCVALTRLVCGANNISTLNLSKNIKLTSLDCSNNNLSVLNVSNSPSINSIICSNNADNLIVYLLGSQSPQITGTLYTRINTIANVVFDDLAFEYYIINNTNYDSDRDGVISAAEADNITVIDCRSRGIKSLKGIERFTNLTNLNCYDNLISGALSFTSSNANLTHIVCGRNNISSINVSACTSLTLLSCEDNNLTSLDLTQNKGLTFLECRGNRLSSLKLDSSRENNITLYCDDPSVVTYQ